MLLQDRECVLEEGGDWFLGESVCLWGGVHVCVCVCVCVRRVLRQTAESHLHLSVWVWIRSDPCAPQTEACNETVSSAY